MATRIAKKTLAPSGIFWNTKGINHLFGNHERIYFASNRLLFSSLTSDHTQEEPPQILMERLAENNTIIKLTLNRPKANAMGKQMIQELQACLDVLECDNNNNNNDDYDDDDESNNNARRTNSFSSCRCLLLTSSSTRVFSAGADLKERSKMTQEETQDFVGVLRSTMQRIAQLPMPVVAAIDGVAVGGGLELALAADLRIVSEEARLGLPETTLAILPGAGGTQRLPRLIGRARAKELIWTGRKLTGREAFEWGLANEVVEVVGGVSEKETNKTATDRAVELALEIAANGPVAIQASKVAIEVGGELTSMEEALEIEKECYAKVIPTQDRLEGLKAFKEGRTPSYKGK